jgi:hypothetical protein
MLHQLKAIPAMLFCPATSKVPVAVLMILLITYVHQQSAFPVLGPVVLCGPVPILVYHVKVMLLSNVLAHVQPRNLVCRNHAWVQELVYTAKPVAVPMKLIPLIKDVLTKDHGNVLEVLLELGNRLPRFLLHALLCATVKQSLVNVQPLLSALTQLSLAMVVMWMLNATQH